MPVLSFPDPRTANSDGIVAIGGDLHPESLVLAYRKGIFPWPVRGLPMVWFSPDPRAVLEFADLHVSRSLRRAERARGGLQFRIDTAFAAVIRACAAARRPGQPGTWITADIISAYVRLHRLGVAHSVEAWRGDDLAGGVYGVAVEGVFSAESMFYREPNASKLALLHLVEHLRSKGLDWIDVQMLTPHVARLGGKEIPRDAFLRKLRATQARRLDLFPRK